MSAPVRTAAGTGLLKVADGVYAYVQPDGGWCLNNAGLVTGADRTVLVDTAATEARARRLREAVLSVAPGGPDYLVNTHFHGDHTFGNALFAPRAAIVAHAGTRADGAAAGLSMRGLWPEVEWGDLPLVLPDLTFRGSLTLHCADALRVELLHVGPAHTADDVVAWVPEGAVLFAGDVVWSGVTPFTLFGSVGGSLAALGELRALRPRVVVPGHGPVGGPELLDATAAYLRRVLQLAEDGVRRGLTPLEAAQEADLGEFAALTDRERLVPNLHRAYREHRGLPHRDRMDPRGPYADMITWKGGPPDCHA